MSCDISKLQICQLRLLAVLYILFFSIKWEARSLFLMLSFIGLSYFPVDLIIMKFVLLILIGNLLLSHHFLLCLVHSS